MSIANFHSLLNGRWFIEKTYEHSLLPSLYSIINGNANFEAPKNPIPEAFIYSANKNSLVSAAKFDGKSNKDQYVLVVSLKNPIYKYNQECGPEGTKSKMKVMAGYESDPNLAGVVLDIDSGGGQVSGTPEFHDFVLNYSKPVVTYTDGMMCSAAYYIGSAAKYVVANKRADAIGSIGVMVSFLDPTGIFEKKGGKLITEYATKSSDKNKHFEELLQGKPEGYIKYELDPIAEEFHADMKAARSGLNEAVLTGGTYNAADSLKMGLIDEIGTMQTAINKVFSLAQKNKGDSNINNSKRKTMSKSNLPLIEAVLGNKFEDDETKDGVILTEAQASLIENRLSENDKAISDAATLATANTAKITDLTNTSAAVTTAVQNALKEAEVEGAEKMSNEEGIIALSNLVKEYGKKDGGKTTQTIDYGSDKAFIGSIDKKLSEIVN